MATIFPYLVFTKDTADGAAFNWYVVLEDCQVQTYDLVIPKNFVTDFASVPRVLWPLFPPYGKAVQASILHDYIYTQHPNELKMTAKVERYFADYLFYETMVAMGVGKFQAKLMYWAVRWFGARRYRSHGESSRTIKKEAQFSPTL